MPSALSGCCQITTVLQPPSVIRSTLAVGQGLSGPPGDSWLPDPAGLADGRYITTLDGQYIDVPAPSGTGDMQTLIYDPQGRSTNAFLLDNQAGVLDAGVFS